LFGQYVPDPTTGSVLENGKEPGMGGTCLYLQLYGGAEVGGSLSEASLGKNPRPYLEKKTTSERTGVWFRWYSVSLAIASPSVQTPISPKKENGKQIMTFC
jgi:hypothetical protein